MKVSGTCPEINQYRHRTGWRRHGIAAALLGALLAGGCARGPSPSTANDTADTQVRPHDDADPKTLGHVQFTGLADTSIEVTDSSGRTVMSGELPCEADLSAGSYTWSARFIDNQRIDDQPLDIMSGDDRQIRVTPPREMTAQPGEEGAAKPAPTNNAPNFGKPWLSTDPMVPTAKPFGAAKAGSGKSAPNTKGSTAPGAAGGSSSPSSPSPESEPPPAKPQSSKSDDE